MQNNSEIKSQQQNYNILTKPNSVQISCSKALMKYRAAYAKALKRKKKEKT